MLNVNGSIIPHPRWDRLSTLNFKKITSIFKSQAPEHTHNKSVKNTFLSVSTDFNGFNSLPPKVRLTSD